MKIINNLLIIASFIYNKKNLGFLIIFMGVFFLRYLQTLGQNCCLVLSCAVLASLATQKIFIETK